MLQLPKAKSGKLMLEGSRCVPEPAFGGVNGLQAAA